MSSISEPNSSASHSFEPTLMLRLRLAQRRDSGHLTPRAEAALQLLAARLAAGNAETEITAVDVATALGVVDELYRADAVYIASLPQWTEHVSLPRPEPEDFDPADLSRTEKE